MIAEEKHIAFSSDLGGQEHWICRQYINYKFKKKNFKQRTNETKELVVNPGCWAELLITGITVSVRGQMSAPDWWSLWVIKAKCLRGSSGCEI